MCGRSWIRLGLFYYKKVLKHEELIYRLAKAQQAIEIRRDDPEKTWKEIAREIDWRYGSSKAGVKLLEDARLSRLKRLELGEYGDPHILLAEIEDFRAKEKKKTK